MSTVIRAEVSRKNEDYISKHRYYELKHFCLQYDEWRKELNDLSYLPTIATETKERISSGHADATWSIAEKRLYLTGCIKLVEDAAKESCEDLWRYMLTAVTKELSYETLIARMRVPCCKEVWYKLYRRFFKRLDESRKNQAL